jgi:hypothetical protein
MLFVVLLKIIIGKNSNENLNQDGIVQILDILQKTPSLVEKVGLPSPKKKNFLPSH